MSFDFYFHRQCCKHIALTSPALYSLVGASTVQCQAQLLIQGSTIKQVQGGAGSRVRARSLFRSTQPVFCLTWPNPVLDPGLSGATQVLEVAGLGSVRTEGEGLDTTASSCSWGVLTETLSHLLFLLQKGHLSCG